MLINTGVDHTPPQVEFYISQSRAANHAVREAACTCIAELGSKVCVCVCVCACVEGG